MTRFDVVPDDRQPDRWFWVREVPDKGRAKRLTAWQSREQAEVEKRIQEQDEAKRQRAAQRREGRALGSPQR